MEEGGRTKAATISFLRSANSPLFFGVAVLFSWLPKTVDHPLMDVLASELMSYGCDVCVMSSGGQWSWLVCCECGRCERTAG
jgi:hypothetical protein